MVLRVESEDPDDCWVIGENMAIAAFFWVWGMPLFVLVLVDWVGFFAIFAAAV